MPRACLAVLLSIAPWAVPALAYASPPDPAWIWGIYDDADFDDVVWMASSGSGDVGPAAPMVVAPVALAAGPPAPQGERATPAPPERTAWPRAPPSFEASRTSR